MLSNIFVSQKFKAGRYGNTCWSGIRIRHHATRRWCRRSENDVTTNGSYLNLVSMPNTKLQGTLILLHNFTPIRCNNYKHKSHSYHIFISYVHRCRYMSIFMIILHLNACSILQCHENFEVSYLRLVFVTMQTETAESDMTRRK